MPDTYFDLFLGYSAFWILVAGYVVHLGRVQRRVLRDLDSSTSSND